MQERHLLQGLAQPEGRGNHALFTSQRCVSVASDMPMVCLPAAALRVVASDMLGTCHMYTYLLCSQSSKALRLEPYQLLHFTIHFCSDLAHVLCRIHHWYKHSFTISLSFSHSVHFSLLHGKFHRVNKSKFLERDFPLQI